VKKDHFYIRGCHAALVSQPKAAAQHSRFMEYYAVDPLIFHTVDPDPFADFPNNNGPQVKRIQVTEATRQRSLIDLATKDLRQGQLLILTAVGRDCSKAVTCVEILKTNCRTVHQITHINQMT